jgi:hypothetical protein
MSGPVNSQFEYAPFDQFGFFNIRAAWWNLGFGSDRTGQGTFRPSPATAAPAKYTFGIVRVSGVQWWYCRPPAAIRGGGIGIYSTYRYRLSSRFDSTWFLCDFFQKFDCLRSYDHIESFRGINLVFREALSTVQVSWTRFQYRFGTISHFRGIIASSSVQRGLL